MAKEIECLENDKFITAIELALDINLLPYERKYINELLLAKHKAKKLLLKRARRNQKALSRVVLIFTLIDKTRDILERYFLDGIGFEEPKETYGRLSKILIGGEYTPLSSFEPQGLLKKEYQGGK